MYYLYLFHHQPAYGVDDDTYHRQEKVYMVEQQDV
jgi:hypothetical protein